MDIDLGIDPRLLAFKKGLHILVLWTRYRINIGAWFRDEVDRIEALFWAVGSQRIRVIVLLALVLGLASTDVAALGALAHLLKKSLQIDNASFGLIATASTAVGAVATLPVGILVDRVRRVPLLILLVLAWSLGMLWSGLSPSYESLLFSQMVVGAVGISTGPVIASLTGDLFPPVRRGRVFGYIVGGELLGAGLGMIMASLVSEWWSWRAAFDALTCVGIILAWGLWKGLDEPRRGGAAILLPPAIRQSSDENHSNRVGESKQPLSRRWLIEDIERKGIAPRQALMETTNPIAWGWPKAVIYVFRIPSNVILMFASAMGYFYFNGLLAFAVLYLMERYHLDAPAASTLFLLTGSGSLVGVLLSGWFSDYFLQKGIIGARIWVAVVSFLLTVVCFVPAFYSPNLLIAAVFFYLAALFLGATNPSLDAARLDIMHSRLWGRAESVRTMLRYALISAAPYVFGVISVALSRSSVRTVAGHLSVRGGGPHGLELAFLLLLVFPFLAGVIMIFAGFTYPGDVATAMAFEHETTEKGLKKEIKKAQRVEKQ